MRSRTSWLRDVEDDAHRTLEILKLPARIDLYRLRRGDIVADEVELTRHDELSVYLAMLRR